MLPLTYKRPWPLLRTGTTAFPLKGKEPPQMARNTLPLTRTRAKDSKGRPVKGIYLRSDGVYVAGLSVNGKWTMPVLQGASSLTEARAMLEALRVKGNSGDLVSPSRATLGDVWEHFILDFAEK